MKYRTHNLLGFASRDCGIGSCHRFGQRPFFPLWLHNFVFHHGK